ncbi:SGNH/GDSL hydrolase family protein [bacterium]|nr:SGNH/GDSL hydrolase family protein [bacterium]
MLKKLFVHIMVSLFSVVLVLLTVELILQWTHAFGARKSWTEPDSQLGYRYTPNTLYWNKNENDHPISGRINQYGWRDRNWEVDRPEGQYRIAVIGDSYVEAFQVEEDSTFLNLVERNLGHTGGHSVELMNFGRSGFTQSEEYLVLRNEVLKFNPQMVLLFFLPDNDICEINPEIAVTKIRPFFYLNDDGTLALDTSFVYDESFRIKTRINPLKQHSALLSLLAERYNAVARRNRRMEVRRDVWERRENDSYRIVDFLNLASSNPDPKYVQAYVVNKALVREMADLCKRNGIVFTLVLIGGRHALYDKSIGYRKVDPEFDPFWFDKDLKSFCEELGVDFINLRAVFEEKVLAGNESLYWSHWSYQGHRLVADVLEEYLRNRIPTGGVAVGEKSP